MTCIVSLVDQGTIWMGGDSAGSDLYNLSIRKEEKVFEKDGKMLIGYTSSFRMGQLIRYHLKLPKHESGMDTLEYLCTTFIDELRECFRKGGFIKKNNEVESGGTFLIGYKKRVYEVQDDFQVAELRDNFNAVGSGSSYALGSLYSTKGKEASGRVRMALRCAAEYSCHVRKPFVLRRLG